MIYMKGEILQLSGIVISLLKKKMMKVSLIIPDRMVLLSKICKVGVKALPGVTPGVPKVPPDPGDPAAGAGGDP